MGKGRGMATRRGMLACLLAGMPCPARRRRGNAFTPRGKASGRIVLRAGRFGTRKFRILLELYMMGALGMRWNGAMLI